MPATPAPRRRRKEARPSELLAAALDLFVEKGFAATRLEDVAARASVSKGTLYLYYENKEALFKAVIREGIIPVIAEGEAIAAKHVGCSFELLDKLLDNWWSRIGQTAYAGIPKLIVAEARNFPEVAAFYYENVISRGRALVGFALKRGMASGEFRTRAGFSNRLRHRPTGAIGWRFCSVAVETVPGSGCPCFQASHLLP